MLATLWRASPPSYRGGRKNVAAAQHNLYRPFYISAFCVPSVAGRSVDIFRITGLRAGFYMRDRVSRAAAECTILSGMRFEQWGQGMT